MRYFAEIDTAGIVLRVIVAKSEEWCENNFGGHWVETFKDRSQRYHFAGIGYTYDQERDAFIPPKLFDSWILDQETLIWVAPIEKPGEDYYWNEETTSWQVIEPPFASWTLDPDCGCWKAPIAIPDDVNEYTWNEETLSWDIVESDV